MRAPHLPALSDAEWKVMNAVWTRDVEVTAREIREALSPATGWAYTTVKTLMDRLVDKSVLDVEVRRNVSWYRSLLPRQQALTAATDDLARRAFGGDVAPLVHHLIQSRAFSASDREELRRMLDAVDGTTGRRRP